MKNIVGIDFGHGETSAGFVISDNTIGNEVYMHDLFIVGEEKVIPSVICIMDNEEVIISPSSKQIAESNEFGVSFKDPIIGNSRYSQISDSNKRYFRLFLQNTYKSITNNPSNSLHTSSEGESDFLVYIACPSGWDQDQIEAYKEFVTNECNIPVVSIVKESRAAYIAARRTVTGGIRTQGGNVLVIDYGSSTIDFTYFNNNKGFEPIHEGYKLGARKIEERLLEFLKEDSFGNNHDEISIVIERCGEHKANEVLLYEIRKQKEEYFISENQDSFCLSIDLSKLLLDKRLRGHYIEPSEKKCSENGLTKEDFLDVISDYRSELAAMLDDFASKEGVDSIDKVILTGGASRMFFFRDLVCDKYNVSKDDDSLIVDKESNVTISRGISAFGYMNEKSTSIEKPLWDNVDDFIKNSLEGILRSKLNSAVSDIYYDEFTKITKKYKDGDIKDSSNRRNLNALEVKFVDFLNSYTTSKESVGSAIMDVVATTVKSAIDDKLTKFAKNWNYKIDNVNVVFDFDTTFFLPVETAKGILAFMWKRCFEFINDRDIFGATSNTPYRDRDYSDRSSIVNNLDSNLRTKCNNLHYDGDLSDELKVIEEAIRSKIQDIIDNAKLEMYR